jgi:hypothetical protein
VTGKPPSAARDARQAGKLVCTSMKQPTCTSFLRLEQIDEQAVRLRQAHEDIVGHVDPRQRTPERAAEHHRQVVCSRTRCGHKKRTLPSLFSPDWSAATLKR